MMEDLNIVEKTISLCPRCLRIIEADIIRQEDCLYLHKLCPEHGSYKALHPLDIPKQYAEIRRIFEFGCRERANPRDLIIYITIDCNQNCSFCYNDVKGKHFNEPSLDRILEKISHYKGEYVHLSGGEPTLRKDLSGIIKAIKERGFRVGLFSNGKRLIDRNYVKKLKESGVDLIILQFDSLNDAHYEMIRGERLLEIKLKVIENLRLFHIPVYLFAALVEGINIDQIGRLIEFSADNADVVKILNFNPTWEIGRKCGYRRVPNNVIFKEIREQFGISLEEFLQITEMSHNLFKLYSRLCNNSLRQYWMRQSPCAQRAYLITINGEVLPISRVINIPKLIDHLKILNALFNKEMKWGIGRLWRCLPYPFLMKEFVLNKKLWPLYLDTIGIILRESYLRKRFDLKNFWMQIPIFSLMIGVFHNELDIDLNMIAKCTLYADMPGDNIIIPACLRQIYYDRNNK